MSLETGLSNSTAPGLATAGAGFLGGPFALPLMAGIGAFSSFLGARSSNNRFKDLQDRFDTAGSQDRLDEIFRRNLGRQSGAFSASQRGEQAQAQASGNAAAARFRRAGLSGVGEDVGEGISAGVNLNAQRARDSFRLEILKNSQQQQQQEQASILALMQTPHGGVSPTSAALGGAGAGIEAVQNARFAEQFYGRRA